MNMQNLMAQAQKMQRDVQSKKEELERMEFIGKSEWITVVFNGAKILKKVEITKDGNIEEEDKEILGDMFQIAVKDAFIKINEETAAKMGQYAGALDGLM